MILPKEIRQNANRYASERCGDDKSARLTLIEAYCNGAIDMCNLLSQDTNQIEVCVEDVGFEEFWKLYDKKRGRNKTLSLWNKLNKKDKLAIMKYIPEYIKAQPDKQYRKDPQTFLRNRSWEDELIYHSNGQPNNITTEQQERDFLEQSFGRIIQPDY